jgi:hypothetical protein
MLAKISVVIPKAVGIAQWVQRLSYPYWTVRESNPGGDNVIRTRPDLPCGVISLLFRGYRIYFLGVKRPGRGVYHVHPSSAEVKKRVDLCLYSPYVLL